MCSKKVLKPVQRRHAAHRLIDAYRISARRACRVIGLQRASLSYKAHGRDTTRSCFNACAHSRKCKCATAASASISCCAERANQIITNAHIDFTACMARTYAVSARGVIGPLPHRLKRLPLGQLHQS